ncbi:MAG: hypothetical protein H7Y01_07505, partial [Ferruginibacter sp.]|nr:hypothetical protein [Chitinophagaceae bacterium]
VLRSNGQDIMFPDGRHRLSFSRFRINIKNKLVEFDSCTIAATRDDSAAASFSVFFDALRLTNIDFDTLYRAEVIKADSVYCVNPKFNLDVELGKRKGSNKPPPKLENIIKQLTGDLQLGYVVVSNADFNIKTVKNGVPNSYTFSNNNFEMQGLSVDQEARKPLTVKSFTMAIRNYENFIKDSTYSVNFDSVVFKDDHITLSNFIFNKLDEGKILNTFSIPKFYLLGLSWDDLVFEKKLKAEQAIMFNPHIKYTVSGKQNKKSQNVFQSLGSINEYMDIQQLDIVDGVIDLKLKNNLRVQLDNATLSVKSHSLLESKKLAGIKNSLSQLKFDKGTIHAGNLDIEMQDIFYIGQSGQFAAGSIHVRNKEKSTAIVLHDVSVDRMQVNELSGDIYADGIRWQKGDVKINTLGGKEGEGESSVELKNIRGLNTSVRGDFGGKSVSTQLSSIIFNTLRKKPGSKLQLEGLDITGKQLKVKTDGLDLAVADYDLRDEQHSSFRAISYKANNGKMTAAVTIPSVTITPHIQPLLHGDIALDAISINRPVIDIYLGARDIAAETQKINFSKIDISELKLTGPQINFSKVSDSGLLTLNWHGERNASNFLQANGLHINAGTTSINDLKFYLTDFIFSSPNGKTLSTGEGKIAAQITNIKLEQEENLPAEWTARVSNFDARDFRLDSIGKTKGLLVMNSGILNNLNISSSTIINLQQLAADNAAFQLKQLTGYYSDVNTNMRWFNAGFNRGSNIFSVDSFSMQPALSKDSFIAKQTSQVDYTSIKTGAIAVGPVDLDTYIKNKTLHIGTAAIDKFLLIDHKDKQLPFKGGSIKPLPVNIFKNIPQKLSVDTVLLSNATVEYTEVNEKTKLAGTIPITRMTVRLIALKNYNIKPDDSLSIQATGYLMDTAWIRLRVKESYTDTLGGFLMSMRVKPFDLTVLNPVLIPLASLKLESGYLDTLSLRAIGREYLSLGEMQMFYHDL